MTLFKQMAIAISLMIIVLLSSVMVINYQSAKKDMIASLYETTVNNISTLTKKLAEAGEDSALMITTIDSEFDGGYYKMIDYKSNDGKNDYLQIDNNPVEGIPTWFINFSNVKLESVTADVSSGWNMMGVVTVSGDVGVVYKALYKMFINLSYLFVSALFLCLIVLSVLLRFILKPLKDIEVLSKNISQGKFDTIEKLPSTLELKNVSISMNDMSSKIKDMIGKLNSNLQKMTKELSKDDLTGLEQEQTFNTDMKMMFIKKKDGYVFSIKIHGFAEFAKDSSNKIVDSFVKDFADILQNSDEKNSAYRFYGSTFAMISYITEHDEIVKLSENLKTSFNNLAEEYGLSNIVHFGVTPFNPISTTQEILEFAVNAYEKATKIGKNECFIRDKNDLAEDMLVWKELVCGIIDENTFNVSYNNQALSMDGEKTLLLEEAFTSATDKNNKAIPIGTFISVAEKYKKIIDFDKAVIEQVIDYIKTEKVSHAVVINIAFDALLDDDFQAWIKVQLTQNKEIASQLIFSMTAYGCVRDIDAFKNFVSLLHDNGGKIILKRFETKFIPLDNLKDLNLDYIRLAKNHTNGISSDKNKQSFIESISELCKLLNIKVFTEDVDDEDDFETLKGLGIFGASIKDILKYRGSITQGIVSYCMDKLEHNIVNVALMVKISTASVEQLQNMMNYSKDLNSDDIKPAGSIEVTKDENFVYTLKTKNIVSTSDMEKIEPKLIEIKGLDSAGIRKRYRELRRSGENTHDKGGGIGFYEIAKLTSSLEYNFVQLNENRYSFEFKVTIESKKKAK